MVEISLKELQSDDITSDQFSKGFNVLSRVWLLGVRHWTSRLIATSLWFYGGEIDMPALLSKESSAL